MDRKLTIPVICLILGLAMAGMAIFADVLGLNQHAGWGRARIGLLLFGASITVCAVLYYRHVDEVHSMARKIQTVVENLPAQYFILPIVIIVILIYAWFGSSGKWKTWKPSTYYYDNLARSFLNANLYLPIEPDPQLLILPNPYDPAAREGIEAPVDLSLYKGKFYMYWGPVPALIIIAISPFIHGRLSDSYLTLGFIYGIFLAQFLLVVTIWRRFFRNLPGWMLQMSILLVGLVGPTLFMRHNYDVAKVYEASITGGQFFLMCGFLVLLNALRKPSPSWWLLALAGSLWALAMGTRLILAVPVGFMALTAGYFIFTSNGWAFKNVRKLIPLALPLAFGLASLGWYNWARFGSLTETGFYYHLGGWNVREYYHDLFSQVYILQNLYNSLLHPFSVGSEFPFINMEPGIEKAIISSIPLPGGYDAQPITGILYIFPYALFSIVPFLALFTALFHRKRPPDYVNNGGQNLLNWINFGLIGSFTTSFGLAMLFLRSAMRFSEDFMPSLVLLSVIGFWQGYQALAHKPLTGRLYAIFGAILASASILLGTFLAISTNSGLVKLIIHRFPFP